jgi:hypothetical protein
MNNFSSGSGWTCPTGHDHSQQWVQEPITPFDDPEVQAMSLISRALKDLDLAARIRVLDWAEGRFADPTPGEPA